MHMISSIKALWLKWTQPHPSLTSNTDRIRSQTLASVLAVMFIIGVLFEATAITIGATSTAFLVVELPIIALVGVMTIFSRRRYYQVVALSLALIIIIGSFFLTVISAYQSSLVFMTLGYLVVATALPTTWALVVGIFTILLTFSSVMLVPQWNSFADIALELTFVIIATVVVYALTFIQRYYMTVNDEKSQQIRDANTLLEEKIIHLQQTQLMQQRTQDNFSKVFYSSPDPIVINRLSDGKYVAYNQSFQDMIGYTGNDLDAMNGRDLFADKDIAKQYVRRLMKERRIFSVEYDMRTKSGEVKTALLSSELIDWHGEECIVCMARDITAHKESQQHKLDIMKEQERASLLQQFINDASHDFRTPLATIGTSVHLLRRVDEDRREHHLGIIEKQVDRINALVDSLTLMYMLDSRNVNFQFYPTNINRLLTDIVEKQPNPNQLDISLQLYENLPVISVDDYYLTTAIKHLLDNAFRFTPVGGTVIVTTRIIRQGEAIEICIQDTGVGMDANTLKHSFNRLYRGDSSRNQATGGAGLGLSITQKIISEHHGEIIADSQIEQGTTVTIVLPLKQATSLTLSAD